MVPIKSNTADQGCLPVSSNCVIWQGPNLSCINLCTGDTISDVVYKLAVELCSIQTDSGISDLDLTCLVNVCQATPEPQKTLAAVLDLIINKICCLADIVDNLPTGGGGTSYVEPTLNLPACLQYTNQQGQTVTQLQTSQYALTIATKLCQINTTVTTHTSQISNHENRITILENAPVPGLPTVTPSCLLPAVPTAMNTVLTEVEVQLCQLKNVLGSNPAIVSAAGQMCPSLGALPALSQAGTLGSIPGWNATVTNLAQSFQNLWITVCDLRNSIKDLQDCCNQTNNCSAFILDFSAAPNNNRSQITLFFQGQTVIPSGFANCTLQGSKVTIKDSANNTFIGYVDLIAAAVDTDGVTFTVTSASLNPALPYTVTVEGCISKNGETCSKTVSQTVSVPCPLITNVTASIS